MSATYASKYNDMKPGNLPIFPAAKDAFVTQVESVLSDALTDLHVRDEVGDCLNGILLDIETTHHLQRELELEHSHRLLEKAYTEQQGIILEAHTERLERYDRRVDLADNFVVELLEANREMKKLMAWKKNHEYKIKNYDTLLAKLSKSEDELREANERVRSDSKASLTEANETKVKAFGLDTETDNDQSSPSGEIPTDNNAITSVLESTAEESLVESTTGTTGTTAVENSTVRTEPENPHHQITPEVENNAEANNETRNESVQLLEDDQKMPATPAEVVSIDAEANIDEDVPTLLNLDMEPLMMVFGFLDAMDILNTAQINLTMYNKVDNIFGISEDGQSPPAPTPSKPPSAQPKSVAQGTTSSGTALSTKPSPGEDIPEVSKAPSSIPSTAGGTGTGLFSMLQPAKQETAIPPAAKASTASSSAGQQQPLNAKVAQSMASKLSDAELAAIISMTDKLSKLEKEVHMLRNEKELFAGKLEGTEAVKQFLIGKVRDVEVKLQRSREDEIRIMQQIASDQEVIAFLDSRVQELEQQTENLTMEKTGTQAGFDDLKVSSSKKITMLSDMLKYEREKLREDESDWKATKKVLVKEVKSCRAQILALQAERDGLKEQNDMLKRAIVSTGNGGSNSSKHQNLSVVGR